MCGIAGLINNFNDPNLRTTIDRMTESLAHRGPDGVGIFIDKNVALGHRRLSIIDLASGDQPMYSADKRYTIVFNGEIYNYIELREELEKNGDVFFTRSDTEVLLNGYIKWGTRCLDKFVGMFAFAIWDSLDRVLFCARDRLGKKPFLYFCAGTTFAFASELKALLHVPGCKPILCPESVDLYLALGYIPSPNAIFKNVNKLPAGHFLEYRDHKISVQRYWYPEDSLDKGNNELIQPKEEFERLFRDAVRLRLRSDVPMGIFLSGGIDSSAIAVELARLGIGNISALTVCFDHDETDLPFAIEIAKKSGLKVEVIKVGSDVVNEFEAICRAYDEPFSDTANVPAYFISREAAKYCKVVITGDGGDEVFGGYTHYEHAGMKHWIKRIACFCKAKDGDFADFYQVYLQSKSLFSQRERGHLLGDRDKPEAVSEYINRHAYLHSFKEHSLLKKMMIADRHIQLPDAYLHKIDMAMGAFGIEGRCPYLDHRLVEWASYLTPGQLVVGRQKKVLFRSILQETLPRSILERRKMGFGSPIEKWLKGPMREMVLQYLPCPLLQPEMQVSTIKKFLGGKSDEARRLWLLLAFSIWAKQYNASW
jgi:asparagine synthase (glutamine-hydrolysing)